MSVKRVTIELDDVPDNKSNTIGPTTLMEKENSLPVRQGFTGIPAHQPDYQQDDFSNKMMSGGSTEETIGRTPSDLIFVFINRAEFMAVAFMVLSFLITVKQIEKLKDLWLTGIISGVLNLLWFGIRGIRNICQSVKLCTQSKR